MELLEEYFDTFESVLTGPKEFYRSENRRDGFGYPLKFAAISLVLAGVFQAARAGFFGTGQLAQVLPMGASAAVALGVLVVSPIIGLVGLLISAGVVHILVALFGGDAGYGETLSALEYATAVSPLTALMALVPVVGGLINIVLGIYVLYLQITGLMEFQNLSGWRAAGALLLPGIILLGLVVAAAAMFMTAGSLSMVQ